MDGLGSNETQTTPRTSDQLGPDKSGDNEPWSLVWYHISLLPLMSFTSANKIMNPDQAFMHNIKNSNNFEYFVNFPS